MDFARTKGMATLALLLTLPVAALAQAPAHSAASNSSPRADVADGRVMITDIYMEQDGDGPSRAYLLEDVSIPAGLMTLAGDVAGALQSAVVPAGLYSGLRIVISEGCLRTDRGQVFASDDGFDECGAPDGTLRMPSYDASGLKVAFEEVEVASPNRIMSLTFDVSQAFGRSAGRSGWNMAPVIDGADLALTASVAATLDPGTVGMPSGVEMGDFTATLVPATGDSSRVTFADSDGDGVFELTFDYVVPADGPFNVRLNEPDDVTIDVSPNAVLTVDPSGGELATVDWLLHSVELVDGGVDCPWWICGL